jgi:hypothetical protein
VFLQDAEGKQARTLRTVDAFTEVGGGEFFPVDGEFRLRSGGLRQGEMPRAQNRRKKYQTESESDHGARGIRHSQVTQPQDQ